jgi:hypothetical protein
MVDELIDSKLLSKKSKTRQKKRKKRPLLQLSYGRLF